jgi:hypothetical protein
MDNRQTLALGIGAVCVALLVGWGLVSLGSGNNGSQAQRAAMASAPSTVGLGSSNPKLGKTSTRARASSQRRASKRVRTRQVKAAPVVQAEAPSLATRRGNPRLP